MTENRAPATRPYARWLAAFAGAAPHLVVLGHLWQPGTLWFTYTGSSWEALPFLLYSRAELAIVPCTLVLCLIAALVRRTRPMALWLLIGTLSGATLVLLALAQAALTWT